jgi:hypothetical protein
MMMVMMVIAMRDENRLAGGSFIRGFNFISTGKITLKDIWRDFRRKNRGLCGGAIPGWHSAKLDPRSWP